MKYDPESKMMIWHRANIYDTKDMTLFIESEILIISKYKKTKLDKDSVSIRAETLHLQEASHCPQPCSLQFLTHV